jgi:putative ABC transport system permease protein
MSIINELAIKNLKSSKRRTILTIISIMLSGIMISAVYTFVVSFQDLLIRSEIKYSGYYYATFNDISTDQMKYIKEDPNIDQIMIEGIIGYSLLDQSNNKEKPYLLILEYNQSSFKNMPITLISGRLPTKSNEILISKQVMSDAKINYKVGDKLNLDIGDRTAGDTKLNLLNQLQSDEKLNINKSLNYTIVGIMEANKYEGYGSPNYSAITYLDQSEIDKNKNYNVSILTKNVKDIYKETELLATKMELTPTIINGQKYFHNVTYNETLLNLLGVSRDKNTKDFLLGVGTIIVVLIMIGSMGVIYNAFNISVTERRKQFGILLSIGSTKKQIIKMVLYETFIIGIIAIILGMAIGIFGVGIVLAIVNKLLINNTIINSGFRLVISPLMLLLSSFFIALTIFLSVIFPAIRISKISPIEAVRMNTDIRIKRKDVKTNSLTRKIFGIEGEIALKNIKRNRRKYRTTIFSLLISIVLFISFSSFLNYSFKSLSISDYKINYDIRIGFNNQDNKEINKFINEIRNIPEIDEIGVAKGAIVLLEIDEKSINNKNKDEFRKYDDGIYRAWISLATYDETYLNKYFKSINQNLNNYKENDVLLSNKIRIISEIEGKTIENKYTLPNAETNDLLELYYYSTKDEKVSFNFLTQVRVKATTKKLPLGCTNNTFIMITNNETFDNLYNKLDYKNNDIGIFITSKKYNKVANKINEIKNNYPTIELYVDNYAGDLESQRNYFIVIAIFLYGFIGLITLIGVTNIFNTITTNIYLRSREFAVLRSIGLTKKGFNKMLNYESIFYVLKALLYGVPISILVNYLLYHDFNKVFKMKMILPWNNILITIVSVFIIVSLTMLYASKKIKKTNIIDAIKNEVI